MSYISKINVNGVEYDINSAQIHIGSSQPTDENIVLWVDTSAGTTDPVTNLTASDITTSSVSLSWTASGNATSYKVYNSSTLLTTISGTSYTVTGLSEGTAYTFKVIATSSLGDAAAVTVTATTHTAGATDPVTNLVASNITTSSVTLSWTASGNATNYKVYNGNTLLTTISGTSYTVTELSEGTAYTFKVIATGTLGDSTPVTVTATTHTAGILPAEYQQVSYISPSVGNYRAINLGIKVADTDKIVVTTEQDFGHLNQLFGTAQDKEVEGYIEGGEIPATFYPATNPIVIHNAVASGSTWVAGVWQNKNLQDFRVSSVPSEYVGLNIKATFTFEFTSTSERYWGIGGRFSSQSSYETPQKIYDIKFYKNSELVAEFVPCYRKEDNKCGFYNITNGNFRHIAYGRWDKGDNV